MDLLLSRPGFSDIVWTILNYLDVDSVGKLEDSSVDGVRDFFLNEDVWRKLFNRRFPEGTYSRFRQFKTGLKRRELCLKLSPNNPDTINNNYSVQCYQNKQIVRHLKIMDEYFMCYVTDNSLDISSRIPPLTLINSCQEHRREISCLDTDDEFIVTGSKDRTINLWNIQKPHQLVTQFRDAHKKLITKVLLIKSSFEEGTTKTRPVESTLTLISFFFLIEIIIVHLITYVILFRYSCLHV